VTAACLARAGHHVIGVDVSSDKVALVNAGRSPIIEAGLDELLSQVVASGHLSATTDGAAAVRQSEAALISVGTPGLRHGRPDVDAIERVGQQIGKVLAEGSRPFTVILRSTVLPGTTERVLLPALREHAGASATWLRVVVSPEFMREGSSLEDFDHPAFVLAGSDDLDGAEVVRTLFAQVSAPFIHTTVRSAELVKYACNAFHGLKVCFANELASLAEVLGADAGEVARIFLMDRKLNVSEAYLRPGYAFGGSCLPKDLRALTWAARAYEVETPVLSAILPSNDSHIHSSVDAVLRSKKRRIGVVGLAFKPGTDDLRESPVVTLVETLIGKGCDVRIFDRNVSLAKLVGANRRYIEGEIPHIAALLCDRLEDLVEHAEALVVATPSEDAAAAVQAARPGCVIFDFTRGAVEGIVARARSTAEVCVQP
jgi:GDP-mannose 6-dehydrogenase